VASVAMVLSNDFLSDPRVEKEARALIGAGIDVTVVAWGRSGEGASTEDRDGITVRRVGPEAGYGSGLANIAGFRVFWQAATALIAEMGPDIVHCHDLDTAPVGLALKKRDPGVRFVLDLHEIYPDSNMMPQRAGVKGPARTLARSLEKRALAAADLVLLANPGFAEVYASQVPKSRLVVVANAPDLELFDPVEGSPEPDTLRVCFIGKMRYPETLRSLFEAVQSDPRLHAYLAGGGSDSDEIEQMADEYERVEMHGPYRYEEILSHYQGCDAVFIAYPTANVNARYTFPNKAAEGMACGLPVLASAGTWLGEFVEDARIGYAVDSTDAEDIARALTALADDPAGAHEMGARGRGIVEDEHNWASATQQLLSAYDRMMSGGLEDA